MATNGVTSEISRPVAAAANLAAAPPTAARKAAPTLGAVF